MTEATRRARDEWIALRCQLGEPAAFADLVGEMERSLLYYVTKLLGDEDAALDVLQNVWVTAFRKIRRLDEAAAVRSWLYRIAHGFAVDRLRKDRSQERVERDWADHLPQAEEQSSFDQEDAAALHRALDELDLLHREVLVLHFLEGWPVAEIASVLGCPAGTVKSRIFYAKKALKQVLVRGGHVHRK
jgi:RNA polymerase sigma-70 factor (ECF subfamily)